MGKMTYGALSHFNKEDYAGDANETNHDPNR